MTCSFMEALFMSLKENLPSVKKEQSQDLMVICSGVADQGYRIQSLKMAYDFLGIDMAMAEEAPSTVGNLNSKRRSGKRRPLPSLGNLCPDPDTMAQEQTAVLESLQRDSDNR
ncbi:hypothetical protein NDU88_003578 [Pleurodeles waltl]|uniref:Uncharacterized protein n=1 Tax=Pleurodeles waltl TaxID=8319 RepID=A0AAV7KZD6_PLEWA|nr:hypothetical protein NDU88_003578 [Pleurodeles waltl]